MLHELTHEIVIKIQFLGNRILLDVLKVLLEKKGRHLRVAAGDGRPIFYGYGPIGGCQAESD